METIVRGLDNVGIAVRDLDRSLAFYCDQFQMKLAYRDNDSRSAGLNTGSSSLYVFETAAADGPQRTSEYTANPTGIDHLSFFVDDVDEVFAELRQRGVECFMDPNAIPVYFLKWAAG